MRMATCIPLAALLLLGQGSAVLAATSPPAPVGFRVDGVDVQVSTAFTSAPFTAAQPADAIQSATAVQAGPAREFSVLALPFGTRPTSEALPVAAAGAAPAYRAALRQDRQSAGARIAAGPVAALFGANVPGLLSRQDIRLGSATARPAVVVEWVAQAHHRLWLVRAAAVAASAAEEDAALAALANLRVTGSGPAPAPLRNPQPRALTTSPNVTPAPWWTGPCDSGNYAGAFALGAAVDGIQACGPRPIAGGADRLVRFYNGAWGELEWECVELSMRYMYMRYGVAPYGANGSEVVWNYPGTQMSKVANPTPGVPPLPGDILSYGATSTFGHTSVVAASNVDASGNGTIDVVEENNSPSGTQSLTVTGWQVMSSMGVSGWLHHDGRLEVVAVGATNDLGDIRQATAGGGWTAWSTIGQSKLAGTPAVVRNGDGRTEVFLRDTSGTVMHLWQSAPGGVFGKAYALDQTGTGDLAAGVYADGRLAVFAVAANHTVTTSSQTSPGSGWTAWTSLGGNLSGTPAVGRSPDGRLELFGRDPAGTVWQAWQTAPNGAWSSWAQVPGTTGGGAVAIGTNSDGSLELIGLAADGSVAHAHQLASGAWSAWTSFGGVFSSPPAVAANQDGRLEVFARDSTGHLEHTWQTAANGNWVGSMYPLGDLQGTQTPHTATSPVPPRGTQRPLPFASAASGMPAAAANADGRLEVVVAAASGELLHVWQTSPGGGWSQLYSLGGHIAGDPAIFSD